MDSTNQTQVIKDLNEKSIEVSREFDAPVATVWRAFTDAEILDQWWGPEPWHAETKSMDFSEGGYWLYAMVGPQNEKHWARMNYYTINHLKSYEAEDGFCDEEGVMNKEMPVSRGVNVFTETPGGTKVSFRMYFLSEAELQKTVEMGFEEGIKICFGQLAGLLKNNKV